jgi:hypothetical protein
VPSCLVAFPALAVSLRAEWQLWKDQLATHPLNAHFQLIKISPSLNHEPVQKHVLGLSSFCERRAWHCKSSPLTKELLVSRHLFFEPIRFWETRFLPSVFRRSSTQQSIAFPSSSECSGTAPCFSGIASNWDVFDQLGQQQVPWLWATRFWARSTSHAAVK